MVLGRQYNSVSVSCAFPLSTLFVTTLDWLPCTTGLRLCTQECEDISRHGFSIHANLLVVSREAKVLFFFRTIADASFDVCQMRDIFSQHETVMLKSLILLSVRVLQQ